MTAQTSEPGEDPATLRAERDAALARLARIEERLRLGHAVDFNDYAYAPCPRDWGPGAAAPRSAPGRLHARLAEGEAGFTALMAQVCALDARFRAIPVLAEDAGDPQRPYWENWWLPGLDACLLYTLIATRRPATYLEVGSGHSTRFVRQAIRDFDLPTRIVSIDPHPTAAVDAICDEVVRQPCETVSPTLFAGLGAGDVLFVDSSHRSFQGSDVTVAFAEIVPALAPGVIYGVHDVFLPWDYPAQWTGRFYNEQYLLMAYLAGGAGGDAILAPGHHLARAGAFFDLRNRLFLGTKHLDWLTSSFWLVRGDG